MDLKKLAQQIYSLGKFIAIGAVLWFIFGIRNDIHSLRVNSKSPQLESKLKDIEKVRLHERDSLIKIINYNNFRFDSIEKRKQEWINNRKQNKLDYESKVIDARDDTNTQLSDSIRTRWERITKRNTTLLK